MGTRTVLTVLSVTIGTFFVFIGFVKFSTIVSEELYKEARKAFIKTAKALSIFGMEVKPQPYRRFVCCNEMVSGLILAFVPGQLKQFANVSLLLQCVVHIIGVYLADEALKDGATSVVFALMLTCRLVLYAQVLHHEQRDRDAAEKKRLMKQRMAADPDDAEQLDDEEIANALIRKLKEREAALEAAQKQEANAASSKKQATTAASSKEQATSKANLKPQAVSKASSKQQAK